MTLRALLMILPLAVPAAQAARPLVTDDARLTDAGACQLETWVRKPDGRGEAWALPACNPGGNLEWTVGGGRLLGGQTTDLVLQAKTLFRRLEPDGWAWGLAAGNVRHPELDAGHNAIGDVYAYLPATVSLAGDRVLIHTNLGWLRSGEGRRHRATWGLGSEAAISGRAALVMETYGQQRQGRPWLQLGVRYWWVPERVQIDTTWGQRAGGGAPWVSVGLRWIGPRWLD
jgi:hypothetical protein